MIRYRKSGFGLVELTRVHGSAAARALVPATFSTVIYFAIYHGTGVDLSTNVDWSVDAHPYPISALIVAFTFLLVFRANFSYQRYWEAAGAVHQMMSKWLDVGIEMAAFHMQSAPYDDIKPPSFGDHPELTSIVRERQRHNKMTLAMMEEKLEGEENGDNENASFCNFLGFIPRRKRRAGPIRSINSSLSDDEERSGNIKSAKSDDERQHLSFRSQTQLRPQQHEQRHRIPLPRHHPSFIGSKSSYGTLPNLERLTSESRLDGGMGGDDHRTPSLFLQELCHLISLLGAVAMSTLRNDIEYAESPLAEYIPGEPWPPVDPDELDSEVRREFHERHRFYTIFLFLTGNTRDERHRTLYNAARPFHVLGGVSDAECQLLQSARGPYAKVALCTLWLQEFISREYLHGSTGAVAPPIISRLFQYTSDGMVGYNQARKVAYIPFPFPHAQLTSLFIFVLSFILPVLNLCWGNYVWFSAILNFFTVLCFAGIHEVARELESPFQNVPNDLPLTTFQAEFNEALIAMYGGYNPDAFWRAPEKSKVSSPESSVVGSETILTEEFLNWIDMDEKRLHTEANQSSTASK